jgi:CD2 antigen cytoplasmic tail-binding protein 2
MADEFFSSSTHTASFDRRNPVQLAAEEEEQDNDEESVLLRQDIEGSRPKRKQNQLKMDFESDSDGNEMEEKKTLDEDDMFGSNEDNENDDIKEDHDKKRKSARFLDMDKFEREGGLNVDERNNNDNNDDDDANMESSSSEDMDEKNVDIDYFVSGDVDQDRSIKAKKKEPKLEAFHLRRDLEEGNFDEEGNFIRNAADEAGYQDQWLTGLSKRDIKAARHAHLFREQEDELDNVKEFVPKSDIISKLIPRLEISENPMEALQRLNVGASRKTRKGKNPPPLSVEDIERNDKRKDNIDTITDCCSRLLKEFGMANVYDMSREELSREYQKETGESFALRKRKRSASPEPADDVINWEFKWEGSDAIHGPYSGNAMADWMENNYFDERVSVRKVGDTEFVRYDGVIFV